MKELFNLKPLFTYFFRKKSSNGDFNLKAMHIINKVAILVFLAGTVYYIIKHI